MEIQQETRQNPYAHETYVLVSEIDYKCNCNILWCCKMGNPHGGAGLVFWEGGCDVRVLFWSCLVWGALRSPNGEDKKKKKITGYLSLELRVEFETRGRSLGVISERWHLKSWVQISSLWSNKRRRPRVQPWTVIYRSQWRKGGAIKGDWVLEINFFQKGRNEYCE